jgi:hypothetical protein
MLCLSSSNVWGLFQYCLSFRFPHTQLNKLFSVIQKSLISLELEHQDTYDKAFHMMYRISFSRNYCIEKSTVKLYISLPICLNLTMKQTCE